MEGVSVSTIVGYKTAVGGTLRQLTTGKDNWVADAYFKQLIRSFEIEQPKVETRDTFKECWSLFGRNHTNRLLKLHLNI